MIDRVKALTSKKNKAWTLLRIGVEKATAHFNATTSQDEGSYDSDISEGDEDAEVIPNEPREAEKEHSKPAAKEQVDVVNQVEANKKYDDQTAKSTDKKLVQKHPD